MTRFMACAAPGRRPAIQLLDTFKPPLGPQIRQRTGIKIEVVPETPGGEIDLEAMERLILAGPKPVLISITHIPTSSGERAAGRGGGWGNGRW